MKAMGYGELWLVEPSFFPHPEAEALAVGAVDLLKNARIVSTVAEAVADCGLVFGSTARSRAEYYWPTYGPREAATRLQAAASGQPVAVLFGSERVGLSNADLAHCSALIQIPTVAEFSSLNLAQAVQIVAYELHCATRIEGPALMPSERNQLLASQAELRQLYEHFGQVLDNINFTDRQGGPYLLQRLERIFTRSALDQREVGLLRGILTAVQAKRRRAGSLK
jgi:TrmH family RNA methyltransferase